MKENYWFCVMFLLGRDNIHFLKLKGFTCKSLVKLSQQNSLRCKSKGTLTRG